MACCGTSMPNACGTRRAIAAAADTEFGRSLWIIVVAGAFVTCWFKTITKKHLLEYGFPSSHSTGAISIGLFLLELLNRQWPVFKGASMEQDDIMRLAVQCSIWLYMAVLPFSRIYCGMHGLLDVTAGSLIGVVVYQFWLHAWPAVDAWVLSADPAVPFVLACTCICLLVLHPRGHDGSPGIANRPAY
ncbi:hypothetical protein THASP1DRAFT_25732 [Thamnocephalis sphaerospora]|uniref:Phosphatidic acid phosphatase type 2/haloperoxidase domain-containing protein n=1 Tax=Thamnocephalis sphaerospora TaxID=78915 RepID=A0A4P9XKP1_9FUNG|nr:hypothetical protein THASP1DRAFT_25732 [Thamnocephalis sphaerospora]|eukprot:RKP05840.1 hypothetical protein THASP1DRAFT_25732 [Thamnocephalis sphaerospora]